MAGGRDHDHGSARPDMRAAARALATRGLHVFPCRAGTKDPLVRWVYGADPATTDPTVIGRWWGRWPSASVAVATGPSGLFVLDEDGPTGAASWAALVAEHGDAPTVMVTTGRGVHRWYRAPVGLRVPLSAGKVGAGLDVRANGGMVIAPPSLHHSGARYRWGGPSGLAPLPGWLAELAAPPRVQHRPPVRRAASSSGSGPVADRIVAGLVRVVLDAPVGTRNDRLNWAAFRLGEQVTARRADLATGVAALLSAADEVGLSAVEADRTVRSGLRRLGAAA